MMNTKPLLIAMAFFMAGFTLSAQDELDMDFDSLFDDPDAFVIEEAETVEDPEEAFYEDAAFVWGGDFTGSIGLTASWPELIPQGDEWMDPDEALDLDFNVRLWFDARPDRNYRVFGKFISAYPFDDSSKFQIYELFSDFNWDEQVFFRFGKQGAAWGLSRFYQIADPLSVAVKNPEDPSADLEGPLAARISLPLGVHTLYAYAVLKDSYLPQNPADASITDVGVGLKADFLVSVPENSFIGNGEVSLGSYYQKELAPKFVASYSTGIKEVQIFTDQVLSWGLDSYRLKENSLDTEKPEDELFWSCTLGAMYVNNDWHFSAYGEYLYNGAASEKDSYYEDWINRYFAEQTVLPEKTLVPSDLFGYLNRHNAALSLSWSELFGTDMFSASILCLQNLVDFSGMARPGFTFKPFDHFSIETALSLAWGDDNTEWIIKNMDPQTMMSGLPVERRMAFHILCRAGVGSF